MLQICRRQFLQNVYNKCFPVSAQSDYRRRQWYYASSNETAESNSFRIKKRLFALALFTGTFGTAIYLKQKRGKHLKELHDGCDFIPIDTTLFDTPFPIFRYKGYVITEHLIKSGVLKVIPQFQLRADDVIVASYPKTGTTWVQEIVHMLTHECEATGKSSEVLETRFPYLEYPYPGIKAVAATKGARNIKTHLPFSLLPTNFKESGAKLVYITRNPRDTAVSYYYFMRFMYHIGFVGTFDEFAKLFLKENVPYSPFFDHVKEYWLERRNPNVLFLFYEDLHRDPMKAVREIANFLQVNVSEEDVRYIAACTTFDTMAANPATNYEHWQSIGFSKKDEGKFMRKGKIGDWKYEMHEEMLKQFEEWEETNLKNLPDDLKFQYTANK